MMNREGRRLGLLVLLAAVVVVVVIAVIVAVQDRDDPAPSEVGAAATVDAEAERDPTVRHPVPAAAAGEIQERVEEMRASVRRYERACMAGLEADAGPGLRPLIMERVDRLASSVDAVVESDTVGQLAIAERLDRYRYQRELRKLQATRPGEASAEATRRVLRSITELLETLRDERFTETLADAPALEEAAAAARAIEPDRSLTAQQHRVQRFFLAAGEVLGAMARPGG